MMMKEYIKKLTKEYEYYCKVMKESPNEYTPKNPENIEVSMGYRSADKGLREIMVVVNSKGEEEFCLL